MGLITTQLIESKDSRELQTKQAPCAVQSIHAGQGREKHPLGWFSLVAFHRGVHQRAAAQGLGYPCQRHGLGAVLSETQEMWQLFCAPITAPGVMSHPESRAVSRHSPGVTQGQALEQGPSQPGHVMMSTYSTWVTLGQGKTKPCSLLQPFFIPTLIWRPLPPARSASRPYTNKQELCILSQPVPPR